MVSNHTDRLPPEGSNSHENIIHPNQYHKQAEKKAFFEIFSNEGSHTKEHLFEMLLSVLCHFVISMTIWHELFFAAFEDNCISSKNALTFACSLV